MEHQGAGLLSCDEELFQRVWSRVTEARQGDPPPPAEEEPRAALVPLGAAPPSALGVPAGAGDATCAALQRWVLQLLGDAAAYRALAGRFPRGRGTLTDLGREKHRRAKTFAAEYFLRSGVRYWPQNFPRFGEDLPLLPSLRRCYAAERRREGDLRAQAALEEPELAHRYLAAAEAARLAGNRLRELLERVF